MFAAEELTFDQRMGADTCTQVDKILSIEMNSGAGKKFPGGHICIFRGKAIPTLTSTSPKSSITSSILMTAFDRLNKIEVYSRQPCNIIVVHDTYLSLY